MATAEPKKKCYCSRCGKTLSEIKFYTHKDGTRDEMCKDCLCAHINNFEPDTFIWILQRMDVPYIPQEWNVLRDRKYQEDPKKGMGGPAVMGKYLSKMKLKQWKEYTYADSEKIIAEKYNGAAVGQEEKSEDQIEAEKVRDEELKKQFEAGQISEAEYKTLASTESQVKQESVLDFNFPGAVDTGPSADPFAAMDSQYMSEDDLPDPASELTDEDKIYLAMKWGRLYKPNEWVELEKKYTEMMDSFDIQDADTRNTLILMCKTDLKMNQAIDCGDVDGYQKLARVSDGLRKSGKFTAAQNKDKDNDQIDCTGALIAVCEREGGYIPRLEVDAPRDLVDTIIQDQNKYIKNLVTKDLGFGQQIENYLKKIQLEHDAMERPVEEEDEIEDEDIAQYYERIAEEKEQDSKVTEKTNAYSKEEDDKDGAC